MLVHEYFLTNIFYVDVVCCSCLLLLIVCQYLLMLLIFLLILLDAFANVDVVDVVDVRAVGKNRRFGRGSKGRT